MVHVLNMNYGSMQVIPRELFYGHNESSQTDESRSKYLSIVVILVYFHYRHAILELLII